MPAPTSPLNSADSADRLPLLVAELDASERGYVLGRLATAGPDGDIATSVLAGAAGARCDEVLGRIVALGRTDRLRLMDRLAREALLPIPAGTEQVHADTWPPILEPESSETIRLIAADDAPPVLRSSAQAILAARAASAGGTGDAGYPKPPNAHADAVNELRRAVLAAIAAVPKRPPAAGPAARRGLAWAGLDPEALLSEVMAAGADLLGTSLQGASGATVAAAAERVAAPWADRVRAAAVRTGARDPGGDSGAAGVSPAQARALVAAAGTTAMPEETLERLGASALGALLRTEDPAQVVAIAQRLPAELAQRLRAAAGLP